MLRAFQEILKLFDFDLWHFRVPGLNRKFPDYLKEVCGSDLMENFTCEKGLAELKMVDFGLYDLRKKRLCDNR